jgi:hypothetical protein
METQTTVAEETLSYEQRLAMLASIRIHTHEVHAKSDHFKVNQVFKFNSLEDAREFALLLVAAARITHDETVLKAKYVDGYNGVENTYSEDDVFRNYESPVFGKGWHVIVTACFRPSRRDESVPEPCREFVFGHRFGANRMADPHSKVFVSYGGKDCDGYNWSTVYEYRDLHEAAKGCQDQYESADGYVGWSVISRDEFEEYPH